ncbi:MAG: hypothetical protein WAW59_02425 [Patescibacteria group bacterium]
MPVSGTVRPVLAAIVHLDPIRVSSIFAVPLKLVPLIVRAVWSAVAVDALPVRFPTNVGAVTVPQIVALPESQRLAQRLPVAPISLALDVA